ncbi:YfbM family protein [Asanoa siamensis]|uniref:DUF1877 family protein n=1 Tax=Asanoa siamensis TaxID=926357 RepID=A0ABQ4CME3_9ACTN|nr:YfbM family protein [Asanoa siamensis]GIF72455.1 hypothetical protein Asi02nite_19730 [Asanoa siamensis]
MGIDGMWLRVTPAELDRGLRDVDWLRRHAESVVGDDVASTGTTWHALDHLLLRRDFPVRLVMGEECVADDVDWGYGPPYYLTPAQVRTAAEALAPLTEADLIDGVDPGELTEARIYPGRWTDLSPAVSHLSEAKSFFAAAAAAGDAVVCWIR